MALRNWLRLGERCSASAYAASSSSSSSSVRCSNPLLVSLQPHHHHNLSHSNPSFVSPSPVPCTRQSYRSFHKDHSSSNRNAQLSQSNNQQQRHHATTSSSSSSSSAPPSPGKRPLLRGPIPLISHPWARFESHTTVTALSREEFFHHTGKAIDEE